MNKAIIKAGTAVILTVASALLFPANAVAVDAAAQELLQQGYSDCKSAHLLRRKDLEGAKLEYEKYLTVKAQAVALDATILEAQDPEVDRITGYCDTVADDIARTEALPVFTEGATACGEAVEYLRSHELDKAELLFPLFKPEREGCCDQRCDFGSVFSAGGSSPL